MDALLLRLKGAKAPVSGTALADLWGVTRAAVHKRVQKLRAAGHRIEGTTRVGYHWAGSSARLDSESLKRGLVTQVVHFPVLGSTQDEAKSRATRGAGEGTLVIADRQTAGRGRMGRSWVSPVGGLWFSLVLRPVVPPDRVPALTLVAALDWVDLFRSLGVPAGVKWPNDVWADGKKNCGNFDGNVGGDRSHSLGGDGRGSERPQPSPHRHPRACGVPLRMDQGGLARRFVGGLARAIFKVLRSVLSIGVWPFSIGV